MAEDMEARLAAINAAKAERARKKEEAEKTAVRVGREKELGEKVQALEIRVAETEQGAQEAEVAIEQAEGMLKEGGLEGEEVAAIEQIKAEAGQKVKELQDLRKELADVREQIEQLGRSETRAEKSAEASPIPNEVPAGAEIAEGKKSRESIGLEQEIERPMSAKEKKVLAQLEDEFKKINIDDKTRQAFDEIRKLEQQMLDLNYDPDLIRTIDMLKRQMGKRDFRDFEDEQWGNRKIIEADLTWGARKEMPIKDELRRIKPGTGVKPERDIYLRAIFNKSFDITTGLLERPDATESQKKATSRA